MIMKKLLDLDGLSKAQKIQAMEELWKDLSRDDEYQSPEWHGEVLAQREKDLAEGKDEFIPWEEAKEILQKKDK